MNVGSRKGKNETSVGIKVQSSYFSKRTSPMHFTEAAALKPARVHVHLNNCACLSSNVTEGMFISPELEKNKSQLIKAKHTLTNN